MTKAHEVVDWSPQSIEELIRCQFLAILLGDCIVANGYTPPVTLTSQFKLTRRGGQFANQIKGNGISLPEAQTAVFLNVMNGDELLIETTLVNLEELRANISSEIERRKIRFPWVYGRRLYDEIADSPYAFRSPNADETQALLDKLPFGVFQYGPYIIGPYGLIESGQWRRIMASRQVPGYHCEKVDCSKIHSVSLKTGDSGVIKARTALDERLSRAHSVGTELSDMIRNELAKKIPEFDWLDSARLPYFLFECFTLDDNRHLLTHLLNQKGDLLRSRLTDLSLEVLDAQEFASGLGEDQVLQLILLASDASIHSSLNALIESDEIKIPRGEVRRNKIVRAESGDFYTTLEASARGVRFRPSRDFLQLRLRQIISSCFDRNEKGTEVRLAWLLRRHEGATTSDKLSAALSVDEPTPLIERLIVADRASYEVSANALRIDKMDLASAGDADLAETLSWHIGFDVPDDNREISDVVRRLQDLRTTVRSLPQNNLDRVELLRVRELASNVFVDLEKVLRDVLHFSIWSLLGDHFGESLVYTPLKGAGAFNDWMQAQGLNAKIRNSEKMDLGEILTCFGSFSKQLRGLQASREQFKREHSKWPRRALLGGNPRRFPFQHLHLILDFDSGSRETLTELVGSVTSRLQQTKVLDVRNSVFHHWDVSPTRDVIANALDSVDARLSELIGAGLYPLVYSNRRSDADSNGRGSITLAAHHGPDVVLTRPSSVSLAGFPMAAERQTILLRGRLDEGQEPMRFRMEEDSTFREMWADFPRRRPHAFTRDDSSHDSEP